jgi:transposase
MKTVSVIGIDLAKTIFHVHAVDKHGVEIYKRKLSRKKMIELITHTPRCTIAMEACATAHYWGRTFSEMGHQIKLIAPQHVKPFVRGEKNDWNDAKAIAQCVQIADMRFVAVKSIVQQEIQSLHRIRERYVGNRTALSNEIRGILAEYGYVIPTGYAKLKVQILMIIQSEACVLSTDLKEILQDLRKELIDLDEKILGIEKIFMDLCRKTDVCTRLIKIPGVGMITATAIWSHIGDAQVFKNGRAFSAYLGLVPRQHSSGGKAKLGRITKRGDKYIRKLLIHGARAVVRFCELKEDSRSLWIKRIDHERGRNKACVALANKNARIIWAMVAHGSEYQKDFKKAGENKAA